MACIALLLQPSRFLRAREASYPLPMTACGVPFYAINIWLILLVPGWQEWQKGRGMAEIQQVIETAIQQVNP